MSSPTEFRNRIEDRPDATYLPEKDRYHLYVSYACPFAHRCLATVYLKGLQDIIGVSVVHPVYQRTRPNDPNDEHIGWTFADPATTPTLTGPSGKREYSSVGAIPDSINGATYIRDLYDMVTKAPVRYTVPVLWDKKTKTIVNNETADIVQMLNTAFQSLVPDALDLFPKDLQSEIDAADEWIQNEFFGNTFKAAFAPTEDVYQESIKGVFPSLDRAEKILSSQRFLVGKGDRFTEADLRFFVGLIHFGVFSLESNTPIPEYPNVANYLRDLYQHPALKPSVNINHIKLHYESARKFKTDESLPSGKDQDLTSPHDRDRFPATAWVKH